MEKIFKEYSFSEAEKQFMRDSETTVAKDVNQSRIILCLFWERELKEQQTKSSKQIKNWQLQIIRTLTE